VRGLDTIGIPSDWAASAPVTVDAAAPGIPGAITVASREDGAVTLAVVGPTDAGSGVDPAAFDVTWCSPAPCTLPDPPQVQGVTVPARAAPTGGCGERKFGVRAHDVAGNVGGYATLLAMPCGKTTWCFDAAGACAPKCQASSCAPDQYCNPDTPVQAPSCESRCLSLVQPTPVPPDETLPGACAAGWACDPATGQCVQWCTDGNCGGSFTFVAAPPVTVVAPAAGSTGGLTANTTVAAPAVRVVAPAMGTTGGLANNLTIANPPVTVVAPAMGDPGTLKPNVTVAQPPVSVKVANQ
jgi:hypothetical protein